MKCRKFHKSRVFGNAVGRASSDGVEAPKGHRAFWIV